MTCVSLAYSLCASIMYPARVAFTSTIIPLKKAIPIQGILLAPTPTNTPNDTEDNTGDRTKKAKLGFVDIVGYDG